MLRYLGYRRGRTEVAPEVEALLAEAEERARALACPQGVWTTLEVASASPEAIWLQGADLAVTGRRTVEFFAGARRLTVLVVTIGPALEEEVAELFRRGEWALATVLDATGSEAADELAAQVEELVRHEAAEAGYEITPRFSPGYSDWPLSAQVPLVAAAGGERIGVRVNEAFLLIPRKSVSAAIGWRPLA